MARMVNALDTNTCARCGCLPAVADGAGTLYLWFPLGHSLGKGLLALKRLGLAFHAVHDRQCVVVSVDGDELATTISALVEMFTAEETRDTKVLFMPGSDDPALDDFGRTTTLHQLDTLLQSTWVLDILEYERVTSHFQPIVHADDPDSVFAQEALLRGIMPDWTIASPGRMFDLARDANLLFQLDRVARLSAIRQAGRQGIDSYLFVNFNPSSVYDPEYCLRSTVQAVDEAGLDRSRVVFEVVESDTYSDLDHLIGILNYYRNAGFSVALDDFGSGFSSFSLLQQLCPDFIKLDMSLIRNVDRDPVKAVIVRRVLEIAQDLGIMSVAEGVETQGEMEWSRAHGASLVQGYFIGRPVAEVIQR